MNIYVASSWRNDQQPAVVLALRELGHQVYDFRHEGFSWAQVDADWKQWTRDKYLEALQHPRSVAGFRRDMDALRAADTTVLVLPSGRSAHLELGYAVGAGQRTFVLCERYDEPDLMYLMTTRIVTSISDLVHEVGPR